MEAKYTHRPISFEERVAFAKALQPRVRRSTVEQLAQRYGRTPAAVRNIFSRLRIAAEDRRSTATYKHLGRSEREAYRRAYIVAQQTESQPIPEPTEVASESEQPTSNFVEQALVDFQRAITNGFQQILAEHRETINELERLRAENQKLQQEINKRPFSEKLSNLLAQWGQGGEKNG